MKKKEKKHRFALTFWLAAIIFASFIITIVLSGFLAYLFARLGFILHIEVLSISADDIVALFVISLILGAILSVLISIFSLKTVNLFISKMNSLASGDFKARFHLKGSVAKYSTIKEITDSFNRMAEELECTEVLRNDFINNFSHEFKTPIVSITGFAKLLKRGNLSEEQKKEYIDIIERESMRLSVMATNVMNLTKYENQTILTDVTEYNLSEQIRSSILALEGKWMKKNINFNLEFEEYTIQANKDMLYHLWFNLLDNAIKFSPESGDVEVVIVSEGKRYVIEIKNKGEELTEDQKKRIFNKFYQTDESHSAEGNGIGLALVKRAVDLHNGEVRADSTDGEVIFRVILPKRQLDLNGK